MILNANALVLFQFLWNLFFKLLGARCKYNLLVTFTVNEILKICFAFALQTEQNQNDPTTTDNVIDDNWELGSLH